MRFTASATIRKTSETSEVNARGVCGKRAALSRVVYTIFFYTHKLKKRTTNIEQLMMIDKSYSVRMINKIRVVSKEIM